MRCQTDDAESLVAPAIAAASQVMWALSGRQFGVCSTTAWPYRRSACGCGYDRCDPRTHMRLNVVKLANHPAFIDDDHEMTVTVDGDELDPAAYRIDGWRYLVRLDGTAWPNPLDPTDPTDPDAWSYAHWYGKAVPPLGVMAAAEMACEILKYLNDDKSCKLPKKVQSVSRQGVTVQMVAETIIDMLDKGYTGLTICDLFIRTVNPGRLSRRARIYRADVMTAARRG
jgi:hypothetical protein